MENPRLSPPPRSLTLLSRMIILASGTIQQIGWGLLCFSMVFFWVFFMNSEARYWLEWNSWEEISGEVIAINSTSSYVNNQPVKAYTYRYTWQGKEGEGTGYATMGLYPVNGSCRVEVNPGDPSESRLIGARRATFPGWAAFVLIFPLISLSMILYSFRQNVKKVDLLRYGLLTRGKLKEKDTTGAEINGQPVYRYTFTFEAIDGKTYEVKGDTHHTHLLEDESQERLLYAKADPSFGVLFDTIRPAINILPGGVYQAHSLFQGAVLILPFLTLSMNTFIAWIFYVL